jgi:hypothetical protein
MCIVCLTVASITAVTLSLGLSGCGNKNKVSETPITKKDHGELAGLDLPSWVISPYDGLQNNVVAGVGISKTPADNDQLRFLIIQAESQARAEIATTLQTEISRLTKDAMQSANIDKMNAVENSFSVVTSEVVKNVPLSGAVRDKIFQDKKGVVYVRVVINSSVVKNYLQGSLANYTEAMQKAGLNRDQIQKTNASMKSLFDELDLKTATQK